MVRGWEEAAVTQRKDTADSAKRGVVYITYDGLLEPLGQSQVLAYLEKLSGDWSIDIISFEKPADRGDAARMAAMRARTAAAGIRWTPLAYHKSPSVPATGFDIAQGALAASWLALRRRATILHARGDVPALMALPAAWAAGAKLVYDIRGFWADERVDGGLWRKDGRLYRTAKALEGVFISRADQLVVLTHAAARELQNWPAFTARRPPLAVIPTCADLKRFRLFAEPPPSPFVFGYVGSVGTWYLFDETVRFFLAIARRRKDARILIVNRKEHAVIREILARHGVLPENYEIVAAEHAEVPMHVARMHAAAALIKPSYSKISSAPTKLAEYLGCGVPCVGNVGVGDMEEVLEHNRVGVALQGFSEEQLQSAADRILALVQEPGIRDRCAAAASELFSLRTGAEAYAGIYVSLAGT